MGCGSGSGDPGLWGEVSRIAISSEQRGTDWGVDGSVGGFDGPVAASIYAKKLRNIAHKAYLKHRGSTYLTFAQNCVNLGRALVRSNRVLNVESANSQVWEMLTVGVSAIFYGSSSLAYFAGKHPRRIKVDKLTSARTTSTRRSKTNASHLSSAFFLLGPAKWKPTICRVLLPS